jgi:hypothetical protein
LEPIPRAIKYLKASALSDGRLARFYELKTNKPLYFTKQYALTYQSNDMPTHYAFIVSSGLQSIQSRYERLTSAQWQPPATRSISTTPLRGARRAEQVQRVINALDPRGAWVEPGTLKKTDGPSDKRIIRCSTFIANVKLLSEYLGRQ